MTLFSNINCFLKYLTGVCFIPFSNSSYQLFPFSSPRCYRRCITALLQLQVAAELPVPSRTQYLHRHRYRATGHHLDQIQSNPLAVSRRPLLSFASSPVCPSTRSSPHPPPTFVLVRASARPSFLLDLSGFLLVYLLPLRPLARVALC
jgi:hypothetical protein